MHICLIPAGEGSASRWAVSVSLSCSSMNSRFPGCPVFGAVQAKGKQPQLAFAQAPPHPYEAGRLAFSWRQVWTFHSLERTSRVKKPGKYVQKESGRPEAYGSWAVESRDFVSEGAGNDGVEAVRMDTRDTDHCLQLAFHVIWVV